MPMGVDNPRDEERQGSESMLDPQYIIDQISVNPKPEPDLLCFQHPSKRHLFLDGNIDLTISSFIPLF